MEREWVILVEVDGGKIETRQKWRNYYVFEFNSPYAEVRASVSNTDDPSLPVETFRAYFLGLFFGGLFGALNQVKFLVIIG